MKKLLLICFLFFMLDAFGLESAPCGDYGDCKKFSPQLNNLESLQLGRINFHKLLLWLSFLEIFKVGKGCNRFRYS